MREWNLKAGDPLSLSLAADPRLGETSYTDDTIWELTLGGGDPPALALQTTYGLRATSLRIFPRFSENGQTVTDPASFVNPPHIHTFYPNFLRVNFSPLPGIDVQSAYWVPESHGLVGRLLVKNQSGTSRSLKVDIAVQLLPTEGQRMAAMEMEAGNILTGTSGGIAPVVFLAGSPSAGSGSYPSLSTSMDLEGGEGKEIIWSHASLETVQDSFLHARSLTMRRWEAEVTRVELYNSGQVEIYTGNPDWDAALALSQKAALNLMIRNDGALPSPSFVLTRQPDQGFSPRGDGSDYNHLWNGQTPLDSYYLACLVLPSGASLVTGLLRNFLDSCGEDGFIDWKPGLGGQRSKLLATPILTNLAWKIYQVTEDKGFLEEFFEPLLGFVHSWFSPAHDRDNDGIPEWDHPMQAGAEDVPLFSRWNPWSKGVDIQTSESPALCSFLFKECQHLEEMAGILEREELILPLRSIKENLRTAVEMSWDEDQSTYHYWDRDTHLITPGSFLGESQGPGEIWIDQQFEYPVRILLRVETDGETTRRPVCYIHGHGISGQHRVEHLQGNQFKWYLGNASLTGELVYKDVEQIEVQGLDPKDKISVWTAGLDYLDQNLLLPLWAGIPDPSRAKALVENTLTNPTRYWRKFGVPACPIPPDENAQACTSIHLPVIQLLGEGLLAYGFRAEAAELVNRVMDAILSSLKQDKSFHRYYHADSGKGFGERNALHGLAPVGLFLDVLGVRPISSRKVALEGFNPFSWPVTIKYRGMTILRQKDKTVVVFPDGQTTTVTDPLPRIISLS